MLYVKDRPQMLELSYVYQLPFGAGRRFASTTPVLKQVLGGWQIAGRQSYLQGYPVQLQNELTAPSGFTGLWDVRNPGIPIKTGVACGDYNPSDPTRNHV